MKYIRHSACVCGVYAASYSTWIIIYYKLYKFSSGATSFGLRLPASVIIDPICWRYCHSSQRHPLSSRIRNAVLATTTTRKWWYCSDHEVGLEIFQYIYNFPHSRSSGKPFSAFERAVLPGNVSAGLKAGKLWNCDAQYLNIKILSLRTFQCVCEKCCAYNGFESSSEDSNVNIWHFALKIINFLHFQRQLMIACNFRMLNILTYFIYLARIFANKSSDACPSMRVIVCKRWTNSCD